MNLLQRIKPEFVDKLVDDKFPTVVANLKKDLSEVSTYLDLRILDATNLYSYVYGIYEPFDMKKYQEIFR